MRWLFRSATPNEAGKPVDLQDFIRDTIIQVQKGVKEAIDALKDTPGVINPVWGNADSIEERHIQQINFDVAVTVDSSAKGKGAASSKGIIKVLAADVSLDGELSRGRSSVSRVTFSVPYIPPVQTVGKEK
ncbi:hypothetical protein [Paracoccus sp. KR1-242]|uniref:hypothetical protein n=1 Tax=Paracoccus sp. KR1-242 TaxID=3410028 RepID=UPI003BFADD60